MAQSGIKITFKENRNLAGEIERELRPQLERELKPQLEKELLKDVVGSSPRFRATGQEVSPLERQHREFVGRARARADAKTLTNRAAREISRKLTDELTRMFRKAFK